MGNSENINNWYKDAIIYQCHVRSFMDSNDDGIGDFKGLVQKLDYLKSLGVNAIWILPFYKSPLKDGGYDISDFTSINEDYGSMSDFKRFIREAHSRDIKVITELVLNHTSSAHKWFERARRAKPGSVYRDFYVWSDTNEKYSDARIIFQDFELSNWSWDPVAKAYYWHRFYSHQPDLNYDNPSVHKAVLKVLDFWFEIGVDGLRLDAVPYLYEREGTNCENLPETHQFLKKLRTYIDTNFKDKMLLAEANQWPEDASAYFGKGDECHMSFHFPLMPRLYMSMQMEDRFPLIDILEQTPKIPDVCQWAIFLRNHDELTLEMVTDEERDYMYKSFAKNPKQRINLGIRRRLAPLLNNDRKNIELMNILLFSMPGTPIIYYGDEIGMGDNYFLGDRDGVRTPMQWSADKNAGFSGAEPQELYLPIVYNYDYHYESVNVENQEKNPSSLLWWMRRIIEKRKQYKAFSRGDIKFIDSNNPKILAFTRTFKDEIILVIINLSRYSQNAHLNLSAYAGYEPTEVFSRNAFNVIGEELYNFPLQFKNYFWFELKKPVENIDTRPVSLKYQLRTSLVDWNKMQEPLQASLSALLLEYITKHYWYKGKARKFKRINILDSIPFKNAEYNSYLFVAEIAFIESNKENYLVPLSIASGEKAVQIRQLYPEAILTGITIDDSNCILYDGNYNSEVSSKLLDIILQRGKIKTNIGELKGIMHKKPSTPLSAEEALNTARVISSELANTTVQFNNKLVLKLYRSPEPGNNPELDIIKALSDAKKFYNTPGYVGSLQYLNKANDNMSLGMLMEYVPHEETAWQFTESAIEAFFDRLISDKEKLSDNNGNLDIESIGDEEFKEYCDPFYVVMMDLLGQRTAELHKTLSGFMNLKDFKAEPYSTLYQKSLYQSFRTSFKRKLSMLNRGINNIETSNHELINYIHNKENKLLSTIKESLESGKIHTQKIKIHGDYNLGQILFTGKDFVMIDFEGENDRPLSSRNLKNNPLKDLAYLLRSLHYGIYMGFENSKTKYPEQHEWLEPSLERWYHTIKEVILSAYIKAAANSGFMPTEPKQFNDLLALFSIEKAMEESVYEINNRPEWLYMPLLGLKKILDELVEQS